jgi:hypothetical protein
MGVDTAFVEGAEIVVKKHLDVHDINQLNNNGFFVKDEMFFSYSRFLMERFISATLLLKKSDREASEILTTLKSFNNEFDGELKNDLKLD